MLFIKFAESSIPFIATGQPPANAASGVNASAAIPAQLAMVVFSDVYSPMLQQECILLCNMIEIRQSGAHSSRPSQRPPPQPVLYQCAATQSYVLRCYVPSHVELGWRAVNSPSPITNSGLLS